MTGQDDAAARYYFRQPEDDPSGRRIFQGAVVFTTKLYCKRAAQRTFSQGLCAAVLFGAILQRTLLP